MAFIDNFSMHGAPHVPPLRVQSVFWLAITLSCIVMLCFQMNGIIRRFVARGSSVSIHMRSAEQTFPAVTFCNLNPIKKDKLDLVPDIKLMLSACEATEADVQSVIDQTGYKEPTEQSDEKQCADFREKLAKKKKA